MDTVIFWRRARDFVPHCRAIASPDGFVAPSAKTVHRTVFFRFAPSLFESLPSDSIEKNNTDTTRASVSFFGGEQGIRTLERFIAVTRFPIVLLRPARTTLHTDICFLRDSLYNRAGEKSRVFLPFLKVFQRKTTAIAMVFLLERMTRLELATSTLARWRSTR